MSMFGGGCVDTKVRGRMEISGTCTMTTSPVRPTTTPRLFRVKRHLTVCRGRLIEREVSILMGRTVHLEVSDSMVITGTASMGVTRHGAAAGNLADLSGTATGTQHSPSPTPSMTLLLGDKERRR